MNLSLSLMSTLNYQFVGPYTPSRSSSDTPPPRDQAESRGASIGFEGSHLAASSPLPASTSRYQTRYREHVRDLYNLRAFRHAEGVTEQRTEAFVLEEAQTGWRQFQQTDEKLTEDHQLFPPTLSSSFRFKPERKSARAT